MRLVGIRGRLSGTSFVLDGRSLTMGRGAGNDVVLATPLASRTHLELRHGQGGWVLHDGGSTNGTSVNGER
jgi:pSer/pThr/pTyr-binding forkhead associated (FHA) protein